MTQYSDYLLQVFEKLGTPLLAVAMEQSAQTPATSVKEAELMASLLGKSTQLGLSLSELVDMPASPEDSDSARLALTALAAPLVANQYRVSGRMPEDQDLQKTLEALKTVMTYSDNFSGTSQAVGRLETLDKDGTGGDRTQQHVRYLYTLIPAVNSVMAFPFGQKEQKMAQEVTERLVNRARQMREEIFPALEGDQQSEAELSLLRSLVMIYSQCHFAEMAKLMAVPEQNRMAALSTDPLWEAFENRVAMLEIVSTSLVPGAASEGTANTGTISPSPVPQQMPQTPPSSVAAPPIMPPVAPPVEQASPIPVTPQVTPPVTPPPVASSAPPPATESVPAQPVTPAEGDNSNPMSFFSKPPADATDGTAS